MNRKINEKYNEQGEKEKRNSIRQRNERNKPLTKGKESIKKGTQAHSLPFVTLPNLSITFQGPNISICINVLAPELTFKF
jgi:hypothetical protein